MLGPTRRSSILVRVLVYWCGKHVFSHHIFQLILEYQYVKRSIAVAQITRLATELGRKDILLDPRAESAVMNLLEWYHYLNYEIADPRISDWILVRTPIPVTLITIAYLYFVLKYGPKYMESRPAYSCRTFITIYNIFQIFANATIVYLILDNGWYQDYFFYCAECDMSPTPQNMQYCTITWLILCLKIVDYIETCLFVLRKKKVQISFLHLYHHVSTVYLTWLILKYVCTGMVLTYGGLNSFIHVIMYTYYLLSTMGPEIRKLIHPGKRIITIIQMVQFVILIVYGLKAYYPGCPGAEVADGLMVVDLVINFLLFYNFYRKNYVEKTKQE